MVPFCDWTITKLLESTNIDDMVWSMTSFTFSKHKNTTPKTKTHICMLWTIFFFFRINACCEPCGSKHYKLQINKANKMWHCNGWWEMRMDLSVRGREYKEIFSWRLREDKHVRGHRKKKKKNKTRDGGWYSFGVSRACTWVIECDGNHESRVRERVKISLYPIYHQLKSFSSSQLSVNEFYEEALCFLFFWRSLVFFIQGMFGIGENKEDEKLYFLLFSWVERGREKWWSLQVFYPPFSKYNLSKLEKKLK